MLISVRNKAYERDRGIEKLGTAGEFHIDDVTHPISKLRGQIFSRITPCNITHPSGNIPVFTNNQVIALSPMIS